MWHEARKQDKIIRSKMVDAAKRSERRRNYYESVRKDPEQFMQIHGRKCKIHVDPHIASAASNVLRKWQGDPNILIDRFDVRSHLDSIDESKHKKVTLSQAEEIEEIQCDFERYKIVILNEFEGLDQNDFLSNIAAKEFWEDRRTDTSKDKKKKKKDSAAISFSYGNSAVVPGSSNDPEDDDSDPENELQFIETEFDVNRLTAERGVELNKLGTSFGRLGSVFLDLLRIDQKEQAEAAEIKEIDKAKLSLSGKNSKNERARLKNRRAALLSQFNMNEDAAKTVLGLLQMEVKTRRRDSSSESDDEGKHSLIIGGDTCVREYSSNRLNLLRKDSTDNEGKNTLRELKNRRSSSPDFGVSDQEGMVINPKSDKESSKDSDEDSCEPLEVRSSMSESEKERREIQNRKRRIKRTKKLVTSRQKDDDKSDDEGQKKVDIAERLRRKMEKKLNKNAQKLKTEEMNKIKSREAEQRERDELLSEDAKALREREREKRRELDELNGRSSSSPSRSPSRERMDRRRRRSRSWERERKGKRDGGRRRSRSRSRSRDMDRRRRRSRSRSRERYRSHRR